MIIIVFVQHLWKKEGNDFRLSFFLRKSELKLIFLLRVRQVWRQKFERPSLSLSLTHLQTHALTLSFSHTHARTLSLSASFRRFQLSLSQQWECNFVCITFHSLSPLSHYRRPFLSVSIGSCDSSLCLKILSPPPSRCASKWQIRQVRGRSWNVNYVCRWQPIQSLASVSPLTSPKQNLVKVWGSQKSDYFFIIVRNQSHLETEAAESM